MIRKIFSYGTFAIISVLLQLILITYAVTAGASVPAVGFFYHLLTYGLVIYIINQPINSGYKLCWVVAMLCFPLYGGFVYLLFSRRHSVNSIHSRMQPHLMSEIRKMKGKPPENGLQNYLSQLGFPVCDSPESHYYPFGEDLFCEMLNKIKDAKQFIYIEFFIISDGKAWSLMEKLLAQKASEGVKIRVIVDGAGCLFTKPVNFRKRLTALGIEYAEFNPVSVRITGKVNYRNHRKILICDGKYAFCCGINISDEYMNYKERFGKWKDTGIMVSGNAAESFTAMFLGMWNYLNGCNENVFLGDKNYEHDCTVQPFSDSPFDNNSVGLRTYLSLINNAEKTVCLTTPYLVCDDEMVNSLIFAAKRGVRVQLITPGIPDKRYVYALTRSHYEELTAAGVEIYEYSPGFIHSKTLLVDGKTAIVGTINFDYRSMFLLFECACVFYGGNVPEEIDCDIKEMLTVCNRISHEKAMCSKLIVRIVRGFLKLFAPLL